MADQLERTPEANRGHSLVTGPHPVVRVSDAARQDLFHRGELYGQNGTDSGTDMTSVADPFLDDAPILNSCDLENPESCESCT